MEHLKNGFLATLGGYLALCLVSAIGGCKMNVGKNAKAVEAKSQES